MVINSATFFTISITRSSSLKDKPAWWKVADNGGFAFYNLATYLAVNHPVIKFSMVDFPLPFLPAKPIRSPFLNI
jgi:hypothetical protein